MKTRQATASAYPLLHAGQGFQLGHDAIEFCQGTFSEMNEDIYEMIEYFVKRKKVLYVHFRNVSGQVPKFYEEFVNTGYVDMYRAMRTYFDNGFDGFFIDDHVPHTFQDTPFGHRGRAHAMGYIDRKSVV